jgi:hypothetical protein
MSDIKDEQQGKTNLIPFEQESDVLEKDKTDLDLMVSNIQEELFKLAEDRHNNTFLIGSKLLDVQRNKLYREWGYEKFSEWLLEFCKEAKIQKTKLWDSKKIVTMLEDTATPFSEVNHTSIKGLYQIARIHKKANDNDQTKKLIEQLINKEITVTELKNLAKEIIKLTETKVTPQPAIDSENSNKRNWGIKAYQRFVISMFLLSCLIFYIAVF